jgi:hypothetical protein
MPETSSPRWNNYGHDDLMRQTILNLSLIEDRQWGTPKGVVIGSWRLLGLAEEMLLRRRLLKRYTWYHRRAGSVVFEQVGKCYGSGL